MNRIQVEAQAHKWGLGKGLSIYRGSNFVYTWLEALPLITQWLSCDTHIRSYIECEWIIWLQCCEVLKYWNIEILRYWNIEILRHWLWCNEILKDWTYETYETIAPAEKYALLWPWLWCNEILKDWTYETYETIVAQNEGTPKHFQLQRHWKIVSLELVAV